MIKIVWRKLIKNKWLVFCLVVGGLLAVCMFSSIPMYSDAILKRMLVRDMAQLQEKQNAYAGKLTMDWGNTARPDNNTLKEDYEKYSALVKKNMDAFPLPIVSSTTYYSSSMYSFSTDKEQVAARAPSAILFYQSEIFDKIQLVGGEMPTSWKIGEEYQVLISTQTAKKMDMALGSVYYLHNYTKLIDKSIPIRVVGVYEPIDPTENYWIDSVDRLSSAMLIGEDCFFENFYSGEVPMMNKVRWAYVYDYTALNIEDLPQFIGYYEYMVEDCTKTVTMNMLAKSTLDTYIKRSEQLQAMLWLLQLPILLMLAFYIFMVSNLILGYERNEISVMRSRGASKGQIFLMYTYQALFLGVFCFAVGPLCGKAVCKLIGSTNGFLEFINRSGLEVRITPRAYIYAAVAVVVFCVAMLLPVLFSSDISIVEFKRRRTKRRQTVFWKKYFLDVLLLAISLYGLYSYQSRQLVLSVTGASSENIPIDPLLFIISVTFILGLGLLVLRLYPLLLKGFFLVGKRIWSPTSYTALLNCSKAGGKEYFIMVFLILTTAMGVYNAISARTINQNSLNRIQYQTGADLVVTETWRGTDANGRPASSLTDEASGTVDPSITIFYNEPQFSRFQDLDGVEMATKVYTNYATRASTGGNKVAYDVKLMAIIPHEFAQVAWTRPGLLPHPMNAYMNLMTQEPRAALLSTSLMEKLEVKPGDQIFLSYGKSSGMMQCIVYAAVDYFPSYNPYLDVQVDKKDVKKDLVVVNMSYWNREMKLEPYSVWIKKAPDVTSEHIYDQLKNGEVTFNVSFVKDTSQQLVLQKNDAMLQGTNGTLTLFFLITLLVTAIGYAIYWVISMKGRALQFGILRSMGMSKGKLSGVLFLEQILLSLVPICMGVGIGTLAASIFVPLLELHADASSQVPPFTPVAWQQDYMVLLGVLGVLLICGVVFMTYVVTRLKINQVLKLGED